MAMYQIAIDNPTNAKVVEYLRRSGNGTGERVGRFMDRFFTNTYPDVTTRLWKQFAEGLPHSARRVIHGRLDGFVEIEFTRVSAVEYSYAAGLSLQSFDKKGDASPVGVACGGYDEGVLRKIGNTWEVGDCQCSVREGCKLFRVRGKEPQFLDGENP